MSADPNLMAALLQNMQASSPRARAEREAERVAALEQRRAKEEQAFMDMFRQDPEVDLQNLANMFPNIRPAMLNFALDRQKRAKREQKAKQPDNLGGNEVVGTLRRAEQQSGGRVAGANAPGFQDLAALMLNAASQRKAESLKGIQGDLTKSTGQLLAFQPEALSRQDDLGRPVLRQTFRGVYGEGGDEALAAATVSGVSRASKNRYEELKTIRQTAKTDREKRIARVEEEKFLADLYGNSPNFSLPMAKKAMEGKAIQEPITGRLIPKPTEKAQNRMMRAATLLELLADMEALTENVARRVGGTAFTGKLSELSSLTTGNADPEVVALAQQMNIFLFDFVTTLSGAAFREDELQILKALEPTFAEMKVVNGQLNPAALRRLEQTRRTLERMISAPFVRGERKQAVSEIRSYYNDVLDGAKRDFSAPGAPLAPEERSLLDRVNAAARELSR